MANGFGPVGATKESAVTVDLDATVANLAQLEYGKQYLWGVLLVELQPSYRRLGHLGTGSQFQVSGGGGGGGGEVCVGPGCGRP